MCNFSKRPSQLFKESFFRKLKNGTIKAKYICNLDKFLKESTDLPNLDDNQHLVNRLVELKRNIQALSPNLQVVDTDRSYIGALAFTIFSKTRVILSLSSSKSRLTSGILLEGSSAATRFNELLNIFFLSTKMDNIKNYLKQNNIQEEIEKLSKQKLNNYLRNYVIKRLEDMLARIRVIDFREG